MKKVLYGKSGSGKSREIVKYINDHDNLLIASPFSPRDQMEVLQYATPIQTVGGNAAISNGFPAEDLFKQPLHGGQWHGIYMPGYGDQHTVYLEAFKNAFSHLEYQEIVNHSANTLILWGGFEYLLDQRNFVEWLTELPCNVLVERMTHSGTTEDEIKWFLEINQDPETKEKWELVKFNKDMLYEQA